MEPNLQDFERARQVRLKQDMSWKNTHIRGIYRYTGSICVIAYHRIFGTITIHFDLHKRNVYSYIGESEIPFIDNSCYPIKYIHSNKTLEAWVFNYIPSVIRHKCNQL